MHRPAVNRHRSSGMCSHTNSRATSGTISSTNAHGSVSFTGLAVVEAVVGPAELVAVAGVPPAGLVANPADLEAVEEDIEYLMVVRSAGSGVVDRRGPVVRYGDGARDGARVGGLLTTKSDALKTDRKKICMDPEDKNQID